MRLTGFLIAAVLAFGQILAAAAVAEEAATEALAAKDPALTELLAKEKEARKACKIEICSILLGKKADGPDVGCHIVKTWPKEDVSQLIKKARVKWPWGNATCTVDVKAKREVLAKAMTEAAYVAELDEHKVHCEVVRDKKDPYGFTISLTPEITFANGKATEAQIVWGSLEAPAMAKSVLWPATALDNQLNVLGDDVVEAVNGFISKKCLEVKDALKLN